MVQNDRQGKSLERSSGTPRFSFQTREIPRTETRLSRATSLQCRRGVSRWLRCLHPVSCPLKPWGQGDNGESRPSGRPALGVLFQTVTLATGCVSALSSALSTVLSLV